MRNFLFKSWLKIVFLVVLIVSVIDIAFDIDALSILHLIPFLLFTFLDSVGIPQDMLLRQCNLIEYCTPVIGGYLIIFTVVSIILVVLRGIFGSVHQSYMGMK